MSQPPTVKELVNYIDYQQDSIVSKHLIDREVGNITLFAVDKDQTISEHTTPFDAFVQVLEGKVEITISGDSFVVEKGEFIIMPANEPHELEGIQRFKMLLTMIKPQGQG